MNDFCSMERKYFIQIFPILRSQEKQITCIRHSILLKYLNVLRQFNLLKKLSYSLFHSKQKILLLKNDFKQLVFNFIKAKYKINQIIYKKDLQNEDENFSQKYLFQSHYLSVITKPFFKGLDNQILSRNLNIQIFYTNLHLQFSLVILIRQKSIISSKKNLHSITIIQVYNNQIVISQQYFYYIKIKQQLFTFKTKQITNKMDKCKICDRPFIQGQIKYKCYCKSKLFICYNCTKSDKNDRDIIKKCSLCRCPYTYGQKHQQLGKNSSYNIYQHKTYPEKDRYQKPNYLQRKTQNQKLSFSYHQISRDSPLIIKQKQIKTNQYYDQKCDKTYQLYQIAKSIQKSDKTNPYVSLPNCSCAKSKKQLIDFLDNKCLICGEISKYSYAKYHLKGGYVTCSTCYGKLQSDIKHPSPIERFRPTQQKKRCWEFIKNMVYQCATCQMVLKQKRQIDKQNQLILCSTCLFNAQQGQRSHQRQKQNLKKKQQYQQKRRIQQIKRQQKQQKRKQQQKQRQQKYEQNRKKQYQKYNINYYQPIKQTSYNRCGICDTLILKQAIIIDQIKICNLCKTRNQWYDKEKQIEQLKIKNDNHNKYFQLDNHYYYGDKKNHQYYNNQDFRIKQKNNQHQYQYQNKIEQKPFQNIKSLDESPSNVKQKSYKTNNSYLEKYQKQKQYYLQKEKQKQQLKTGQSNKSQQDNYNSMKLSKSNISNKKQIRQECISCHKLIYLLCDVGFREGDANVCSTCYQLQNLYEKNNKNQSVSKQQKKESSVIQSSKSRIVREVAQEINNSYNLKEQQQQQQQNRPSQIINNKKSTFQQSKPNISSNFNKTIAIKNDLTNNINNSIQNQSLPQKQLQEKQNNISPINQKHVVNQQNVSKIQNKSIIEQTNTNKSNQKSKLKLVSNSIKQNITNPSPQNKLPPQQQDYEPVLSKSIRQEMMNQTSKTINQHIPQKDNSDQKDKSQQVSISNIKLTKQQQEVPFLTKQSKIKKQPKIDPKEQPLSQSIMDDKNILQTILENRQYNDHLSKQPINDKNNRQIQKQKLKKSQSNEQEDSMMKQFQVKQDQKIEISLENFILFSKQVQKLQYCTECGYAIIPSNGFVFNQKEDEEDIRKNVISSSNAIVLCKMCHFQQFYYLQKVEQEKKKKQSSSSKLYNYKSVQKKPSINKYQQKLSSTSSALRPSSMKKDNFMYLEPKNLQKIAVVKPFTIANNSYNNSYNNSSPYYKNPLQSSQKKQKTSYTSAFQQPNNPLINSYKNSSLIDNIDSSRNIIERKLKQKPGTTKEPYYYQQDRFGQLSSQQAFRRNQKVSIAKVSTNKDSVFLEESTNSKGNSNGSQIQYSLTGAVKAESNKGMKSTQQSQKFKVSEKPSPKIQNKSSKQMTRVQSQPYKPRNTQPLPNNKKQNISDIKSTTDQKRTGTQMIKDSNKKYCIDCKQQSNVLCFGKYCLNCFKKVKI